jgi:exopolyphosphatase/guanosine-5'-triphosphate,3'-diphosphate pyrophosphatase
MLEAVAVPGVPASICGVGGTFTSLAALLLDLHRHDPERVHASTFPTEAFTRAVERLAPLSIDETEAIPSLDPARAPVLLGGAIVVERALRHVGADRVVVSEADILDGLALSALRA